MKKNFVLFYNFLHGGPDDKFPGFLRVHLSDFIESQDISINYIIICTHIYHVETGSLGMNPKDPDWIWTKPSFIQVQTLDHLYQQLSTKISGQNHNPIQSTLTIKLSLKLSTLLNCH